MPTIETFGIEVNFLTGRYVATYHNKRDRAEWPPHPARLFSALVATWADGDCDVTERQALEWLETQGPPSISTPSATPREPVSHFVPVNDTSVVGKTWYARKGNQVKALLDRLQEENVSRLRTKLERERVVDSQVSHAGNTNPDTARAMLPTGRGKQERHFPSVTPDQPRVTYIWTCATPVDISRTFDRLLERVTRLGHSSSLVSCRVVTETPEATLVPSDVGESVRTVSRGQLAELQRQFKRHGGIKPRGLPYTQTNYGASSENQQPDVVQAPNTAGDWIVFEFEPRSRFFPVTRGVDIAQAMRAAVLHYADDPVPEELSGHRPRGAPTRSPHVAFLPLPNVGYPHADGRIMGIAVSVPSVLSPKCRQALFRAIGIWESAKPQGLKLTMGSLGEIRMFRVSGPSNLVSLRPSIWRRQSSIWISATPIALPRHPGRLVGGSQAKQAEAWERAEASLRTACSHVELPDPLNVELSLTPFLVGARGSAQYPPFSQNGRDGSPVRRQLVHASLTFGERVSGPLSIGAGRFFGLGLMRPMHDEPEASPADSGQEQNID